MKKRILKDMLKEQELVIGGFQQIVYPEITEHLALSGWDYIIVDLEHTHKTIEAAAPCIVMGAVHNIPMLVRVWEKEQALIEQALDAGAQGVVVPTVETPEECEMIVRAAKFAPEGTRGWCNVLPAKRWMNEWENDPYREDFDPATYCRNANRDTFLAALVETPGGIKNLPEMLKVEGIDAFLLGSGDCSIRMGKTLWDPEVADMMANAIRQIQTAGKTCCPIGLRGNIERLYKDGSRMVMLGIGERMAMQKAMREEIEAMRKIIVKIKN